MALKLTIGIENLYDHRVKEVAEFMEIGLGTFVEKATKVVDTLKPKKDTKAKSVSQPPTAEDLPSYQRGNEPSASETYTVQKPEEPLPHNQAA